MTSTEIPVAVAVEGGEDATPKKSSAVTLVYGLDVEVDRVEISSESLRKESSYFAGLLQQNPTKHLSIEAEYPDVFREFIIPYLLSNKEPKPSESIWKVWKVAQDLGMMKLILQVKQSIASSLEKHIQSSDFNPSFVTKEQLYELLMLNFFCFPNEKAEDITTKRLRILLYWLREESVEDCLMMNKWFAAKFDCSWMLHISRSHELLPSLQQEFPNTFEKCFNTKAEAIEKYILTTKQCLKYEVKGAGEAVVNGIYHLTSVKNSCPVFTHTNEKDGKVCEMGRCTTGWYIGTPDGRTDYYYTDAKEEDHLPPTKGWATCDGKSPAPEVICHMDFSCLGF